MEQSCKISRREKADITHFLTHKVIEEIPSFMRRNEKTIEYKKLPNVSPNYFFQDKDFGVQGVYDGGISIDKLFQTNSVGVVTAREDITITFDKSYLENIIHDFKNLEAETIRKKYLHYAQNAI